MRDQMGSYHGATFPNGLVRGIQNHVCTLCFVWPAERSSAREKEPLTARHHAPFAFQSTYLRNPHKCDKLVADQTLRSSGRLR